MQRTEVNITTGQVEIIDLTPEEIAAIKAAQPDPAIAAAKQQVIAAAGALFDAMPLGLQALWSGVKQAVSAAIANGDFATAKTILETVPNLYEGMEADRASFLKLFP